MNQKNKKCINHENIVHNLESLSSIILLRVFYHGLQRVQVNIDLWINIESNENMYMCTLQVNIMIENNLGYGL